MNEGKDLRMKEMVKSKRRVIWLIWVSIYIIVSFLCLAFSLDLLDWLGGCSMGAGHEKEICRVETLSWMGPPALLIFIVPDIELCIIKDWNCHSPFLLFAFVYIGCSAGLLYNVRRMALSASNRWKIALNVLAIVLLWGIGGMVSGMALT